MLRLSVQRLALRPAGPLRAAAHGERVRTEGCMVVALKQSFGYGDHAPSNAPGFGGEHQQYPPETVGNTVKYISENMTNPPKYKVSLGKEQFGKSVAELERFRTETWDELTSILENQRRIVEENNRLDRYEALQIEAERERGFQQQIEELRTDNADGYNKCKIALEKGIQDGRGIQGMGPQHAAQELEQHLEKMLATYLLNKEKLEYNLQVLSERNKEHTAIQSSYKNRLNRLRETLNTLMSRYNTLDQKYKTHNHELTEEYKRVTKQFKDLQEKFQHFEQADEKKFREVWEMNEAEVRGLMTKVLEADRLLHEQQLGHEWVPPKEELLQQELDTFSESGTTTGKSTALESADMGQDVLQIDALLRYIGVEGQQDVDLLVQVFYNGQEEDDEALMVEPDDVLQHLKNFIQEKENARIADVAPDKKKKARTQQLGSESEADRKARRRREERKFWERMGHVIPDMNFRVWKALDVFLKRYYELLQRRSKTIDSAVAMQKQNEELKALLDQYLGSRVNEELQVPPTHVITVVSQP
eukprot:Skav206539  [mRNA]  locus=scaffold504:231177:241421:+ [translate_table: standard]